MVNFVRNKIYTVKKGITVSKIHVDTISRATEKFERTNMLKIDCPASTLLRLLTNTANTIMYVVVMNRKLETLIAGSTKSKKIRMAFLIVLYPYILYMGTKIDGMTKSEKHHEQSIATLTRYTVHTALYRKFNKPAHSRSAVSKNNAMLYMTIKSIHTIK